jgi:hypothetical protein
MFEGRKFRDPQGFGHRLEQGRVDRRGLPPGFAPSTVAISAECHRKGAPHVDVSAMRFYRSILPYLFLKPSKL